MNRKPSMVTFYCSTESLFSDDFDDNDVDSESRFVERIHISYVKSDADTICKPAEIIDGRF